MAFVRVADPAAVPHGRALLVEGEGAAVALFNAGGGRFYACAALCPHDDGPLVDGWLEGDFAICPWHGYDFDLRTGRCRVDPKLAVAVYPVRVAAGGVEVDRAGH
jgi:nitrite reductase/ring-hydroxylating ferredoxin subunit